MSLGPGTRLGPYEVIAAIGAGGMGEVYRARDSKLNRDVALKILPAAFASDADRLARFHREAQVLAALNHPHIGAIYGFEDSGDTHALVLEFVDGPTLADRIALGPIPVDEALPIAIQIAEALEAAHTQGIIHRDLKPANIKLRPDGTVKVLDFGLAKLAETGGTGTAGATSTGLGALSLSPTMTSPPLMTGVGVLLGTAAYMAPEQVRGRAADQRSDIWAFGCVVYEMLTGQAPFDGEDTAEMLGAVMKTEPDWTRLPSDLPSAVRTILPVCLQKDLTKRFRHAGDLALAFDAARAVTSTGDRPTAARTPFAGRGLAFAVIFVLVGLTLGAIATWTLRGTPSPPATGRFRAMLPADQRMAGLDLQAVAFAPDGQQFVYVATTGGPQQLYLGRLDSFDARPIAGTEGAANPFFSPDGQWVGFFTSDNMKKVALTGGPPVSLARVDNFGRGAAWSHNGTIVFSPGFDEGLFAVSDAGGPVRRLTSVNRQGTDGSHRFPHFLPGEDKVLFTAGTGGSWDEARIEVLTLATGTRKMLIQGGSDARYVPTGHVVYARAGAMMAVPIDVDRVELTGAPAAVLDGLLPSTGNTGSAQIAFSDAGAAMYVPGGAGASDRALAMTDRNGQEQRLPAPPRAFRQPRLSPDGQQVVLDIDEGNKADAWVYDVSRGTLTRLTFSGQIQFPVWTTDGTRVTYQSLKNNARNIVWKKVDGNGGEETLATGDHSQLPGTWADGDKVFVYADIDPMTGSDIWSVTMTGDRRPRPFLQTPFNEGDPAISPDGRWVAYESDESGRNEIYIQPFPEPGAKTLVSTDGGTEPAWSGNGQELFYRNGDRMMAVSISGGPVLHAARPVLLFTKPFWTLPTIRNYDVSRDGRRFLMVTESEQASSATHVNVVLNWFDDVRRLAQAK